MWVLLPLISILLTINLLERKSIHFLNDTRLSIVVTLIFHAAFVFISTELFSLFNAINNITIKFAWSLVVVTLAIITLKFKPEIPNKSSLKFRKYFRDHRLITITTLVIIFGSLLTCFFAYPNTWDSMTYHLPRVVHWMQNENVNHYPSHIDRQLGLSPLGEYCFLHLKLLSSYDPFLNLVQWLSMTGSVITMSLIAKAAGGKKRMQLITAFLTAAIPMGILQSNSTQNDYVVSFFIAAGILFLFKCLKNNFTFADSILFMLCCCLAVASKGTAFVFLLPIVFIWLVVAVINLRYKIFKPLTAGIVLISIFCLPQFIRNIQTFGSPLGADYQLANEAYGISPTLSNMSKNMAIHLRTPFPEINTGIENATIAFNNLIGINVQSGKYNWRSTPPFQVGYFSTHEDSAGNFLHVLLFVFSFILFLLNKKIRANKQINMLLLITVVMYILFSTILKWQIWNCRLQLPMFIIMTPFLAYAVNVLFPKKILYLLLSLFTISACLFLFVNQSRMWFGKENIFTTNATAQYFNNNDKLKKPFVEITDSIKKDKIQKIGLVTSGDAWQYPFSVLMQKIPEFEIQQVMVQNESNRYESMEPFVSFKPDAIIFNNYEGDTTDHFFYKNETYNLIYQYENWMLFQRAISTE